MKIEDVFQKVKKGRVEEQWKQSEQTEDPLISEWIKRKREKTKL